MTDAIIFISVNQLDISSGNIRRVEYFDDILDSLKRGEPIREPLFVYWNEEKGQYLIVDGGRRFRAGIKFGLTEFPCIIFPEITNEVQALHASIKHCNETIGLSPVEIALGVKGVLKEYLKTLAPQEARRRLMKEFGFSKTKLSRLEKIADADPQLIVAVSHCETPRERISENLWYQTALRPLSVQKEMAQHEWNNIKDLRGFINILREHSELFQPCTPKERVRLSLKYFREGYSHNRIKGVLTKRAGIKQSAQQVRLTQYATAASVKAAGNKIPAKNMVTRTLTIGPRLDYWWDANKAVAELLGYNSLEEHVMKTHLDPEAADYWTIYSKKMGYGPKVTLGKLRRQRTNLRKKLSELDEQIAEMELEHPQRRKR